MSNQQYPAQALDTAASERSILIIDDDALNLKLFAMTLAGRGYRVLLAMDARFTSPVFPGDHLKVEVWRTGPGKAAFRTTSLPRRVVVLDNGSCEFKAS